MHLDHDVTLRLAALLDGANYAATHMQGALAMPDKHEVLRIGLAQVPQDGLCLACGVFSGSGLEDLANGLRRIVHGFDTTSHAVSPTTHARFTPGRFEQSLPPFLAQNPGSIAFLHVDTDLYAQTMTAADGVLTDVYAATRSALELVGVRLVPGSVIVLDEYLNSPGWRGQEFRAFQECVQSRGLRYRYLAYDTTGFGTVALQIVA